MSTCLSFSGSAFFNEWGVPQGKRKQKIYFEKLHTQENVMGFYSIKVFKSQLNLKLVNKTLNVRLKIFPFIYAIREMKRQSLRKIGI